MALLSTAAQASAVTSGEPKQPTSKWIVNFADAQRVATRNYGTEFDQIYLVLKSPAIGESIQLGIVRKGGNLDAGQVGGEIQFDEAEPVKASFLEFGVKSMGQRADS